MQAEPTAPPTRPEHSRIFIVDDDPFQVQLLESILEDGNHDVIGFSDSLEALENSHRLMPDLVLLDLIMPGLDGFEMCQKLKEDPRTCDIPIILITARNDKETESKGFEMGAVDFIAKPFNPVVTKARIRNQLELKKHRDSLELLVRERTAERDKSLKQFQDLVEQSLVGIAIVQDEKVIYQNPELSRTVDQLAEKVLCRDFSFIHPEDLAGVKLAYQNLLNRESDNAEADLRIQIQVPAKNHKKYIWVNCRASLFEYQGKESILINLVDITHTKELERLLLVRNKMSSLGRIASGMAHEIRNPLTGITSYLYTLEQMCETETLLPKDIDLMKQIVGQLKLASHKVDSVIKRVLDFSKPTAPRMVPIDINKCLDNVISLSAVTLRKAGIQVTTSLFKQLPTCYGDGNLIEQVFLNLIQNAGHALREATDLKKIAVTTYTFDNEISITFSDSGPGVPEELRDKIFDPFFTTSPDGSGIGLSIAQRIVTDHNGSLTVTAGELGGAHFTIILPIEKRKYPR